MCDATENLRDLFCRKYIRWLISVAELVERVEYFGTYLRDRNGTYSSEIDVQHETLCQRTKNIVMWLWLDRSVADPRN